MKGEVLAKFFEKFFSEILPKLNLWFVVTDNNHKIIFANEYVSRLSGYSIQEILGKNYELLFHSSLTPPHIYLKLEENLKSGKSFSEIFINVKKSGELFYLKEIIHPIKLNGELFYLRIGIDITEFKIGSSEFCLLGEVDPVFKIYSFFAFKQKLKETVDNLHRKENLALFLLGFRNLNLIYENFGRYIADRLFQKGINLIKDLLKNYNFVIGKIDDETLGFFLIFPEERQKNEVLYDTLNLCVKIIKTFQNAIEIEEKLLKLEISIGIAIFPLHADSSDELFSKAEKALVSAKKRGSNNYIFYDPSIEAETEEAEKVCSTIARAIEENRLIWFFQPYFYTQNLKLAGFEALVRLVDTNNQLVPPSLFIPYLEKSPFIINFDLWMFKEIERIIEKIKKVYHEPFTISINITPTNFFRDDFWEIFLNFIHRGLGKYIVIEITERIFVEKFDSLSYLFSLLKKTSPEIKISIDDFGEGATSFRSLISMPIDIVKLDMSYIENMLKEEKISYIVENIINFCNKLGIQTVAEGVETREQYEKLKELSCTMVQGFYFEKPLPEEEMFKKYFS